MTTIEHAGGVADLDDRIAMAREVIEQGTDPSDLSPEPLPAAPGLASQLDIPFPNGRAPTPEPIDPPPDPGDPLPEADVVVVTWTVAELNALADVLTPGQPRSTWYRYDRNFDDHFRPLIRAGAPALQTGRLGSWFPTRVGDTKVLCLKSELHLNQDGIPIGDGLATLPVKDMFQQVIDEAKPRVVLSVGTSGGVATEQSLGDAVVTRSAKFRCRSEFAKEPWNGRTFTSDWALPTTWFDAAEELMAGYADRLVEPDFAPPTKRYHFDGPPLPSDPPNTPTIHVDDRPVLTTDFFEFGTSANHLDQEGSAVEMGDAVLGLLCDELAQQGHEPPRWAIVRNISDPVINGDLPTKPAKLNMQAHWAVWYYEAYGYWTSVTGALTTWAILAGLDDQANGGANAGNRDVGGEG
jgi:hypothetical protein